jgi:hypothetical protein
MIRNLNTKEVYRLGDTKSLAFPNDFVKCEMWIKQIRVIFDIYLFKKLLDCQN